MKTLNLTLRTILFALASIGIATTAAAYDFKVDGLYYDINNNGDEVSVTYKSKIEHYGAYSVYYSYENDNSGDVVIPETVTYNGITYAVTSIGEHAFEGCTDLTSISIPKTVTEINEWAFWICSSLRGIISFAIIPPIFYGTNIFATYSGTLYVPLASLEEYKSSSVWSGFSNIIGFGQNTLSMVDYTTCYGDTLVIPVSMENVDDITAFQTDIYLPEGFELLKDGDDYFVSLSDRKGRDHVIMANDAPDGAVRVLSYSPTLKTFSGNDGELFYFMVKVPTDGDGIITYPIWLRKTLLTTTEEEEVGALEALSKVAVYFYILGDVDHSGAITVADIVQTARYILNYNPEPFIFDAADINGDGNITITDVVKIAHMVLDADYDEPRLTSSNSGDRMGGEINNQTVSVTLENDLDYTAFQMDLTLPEGMTASDFALTERANGLGLIVKDRSNGEIRVLGYAADLKTIKGHDGSVLTFNVEGEMGDIIVNNIELVNLDGQSVNFDTFAIAVGNSTALNEMATRKAISRVEYFNIAGQQLVEPATGVTLVVTTYADGTRFTEKVIR